MFQIPSLLASFVPTVYLLITYSLSVPPSYQSNPILPHYANSCCIQPTASLLLSPLDSTFLIFPLLPASYLFLYPIFYYLLFFPCTVITSPSIMILFQKFTKEITQVKQHFLNCTVATKFKSALA